MSEATEAPDVEIDVDEEEPVTKTGRVLTPSEWAEIVELWELGETTLADLAGRFGITPKGISKGLKKRKAEKGSRSHEIAERVRKTVLRSHESEAMSAVDERKRKIDETKTQHYDWAKALAQQVMSHLLKAQKEMRPFSSEKANIKVLKDAAATLSTLRKERYVILEAENDLNENELPTLDLRDLSEQEIKDLASFDADDGVELPELPPDLADVVEEGDGSA